MGDGGEPTSGGPPTDAACENHLRASEPLLGGALEPINEAQRSQLSRGLLNGVSRSFSLTLRVLPPARSTHVSEPVPQEVRLEVSKESRSVRVPFGRFSARIVTAARPGEAEPARFTIEDVAPYRLLAYRGPEGLELSLRFHERRAYWDRSKPSRFYRQGAAP